MSTRNMVMKVLCFWAFVGIFLVGVAFLLNAGGTADNEDYIINKKPVIELSDANWRLMLKGEWMVEFFAPWCPACKSFQPIWERFAVSSRDVNVKVAQIDITTSSSLNGRFFITALPTIYHVKDGDFRQYRGSRDFDALMFFVKQKQWIKVEPLSVWKKPNAIHMSVLSYIYKLSNTLKEYNVHLQKEFGLPSWGAYACFAVSTILIGAVVGLTIVCCIDFLYTPNKSIPSNTIQQTCRQIPRREIEDLDIDEIEDDANLSNDEESSDSSDELDELRLGEERIQEDDEGDEYNIDENIEGERNNDGSNNEDNEVVEVDEVDEADEENATGGETVYEIHNIEVRKRKPRKAD